MNRSEWAERLPLIQAFVEGKQLQVFYEGEWIGLAPHVQHLSEEVLARGEYRIKPEPKVIWVAGDESIFYQEDWAEAYCTRYNMKFTKYVEIME